MLRSCALETPAFAALLDVWKHREYHAALFRDKGGLVVGCLGGDVPEEYILAAGMMPVRIPPDPKSDLAKADEYLEACFDPQVRSQFDRIVRGESARLCDYLAISNSTDVLVRVYLYLRELRRTEPDSPVPPVAFIDWLFTRSRKFQLANEKTAARFRATCEEWAGRAISDEEIAAAAAVLNENRLALERISALRKGEEMRVSGSEALVITGAGFYMDKREHTALVSAVAEAAESWPVLEGPRVYLSGTEQYETTLYDLFEAAGAQVAAEDSDTGMRWYERPWDTSLPPERAAADRYVLRSFSPKKALVSQRTEALCRAALDSKVQGVAMCMNQFEEAASWDFPEERQALETIGIRAIELEKLPYPAEKDPSLPDKIAAFVDSMKGGD